MSVPVSLPSIQPSEPASSVQDHHRQSQSASQASKAGVEGDTLENVSEEPDMSTLSLTEKMALFNRLSHAADKKTEGLRGDSRLRRARARFQTQPITPGEVAQVRKSTSTSLIIPKCVVFLGPESKYESRICEY